MRIERVPEDEAEQELSILGLRAETRRKFDGIIEGDGIVAVIGT